MHTQGVQDMHGLQGSHDAGWSMVVAGQVRLGRTGQSDGSTWMSVGTEDGGGIGDVDIGA